MVSTQYKSVLDAIRINSKTFLFVDEVPSRGMEHDGATNVWKSYPFVFSKDHVVDEGPYLCLGKCSKRVMNLYFRFASEEMEKAKIWSKN